jgi:hypothetical protein
MTAVTFDTLKYAEQLEASGVPTVQAKAGAQALAEALSGSELATEQDILRLELRLAETKAEIIRWVVGMGFFQTTLVIGVLAKASNLI